MRGKLHAYDTLLAGLARDLHDMAAELRQFIQEEHAVVGPRHVTRHRYVAPPDQPRIREGVVGRATRAGRHQRRAVAGEARDAVEVGGLEGFGWLIAGKMVVSRRASLDVPPPGYLAGAGGEHLSRVRSHLTSALHGAVMASVEPLPRS